MNFRNNTDILAAQKQLNFFVLLVVKELQKKQRLVETGLKKTVLKYNNIFYLNIGAFDSFLSVSIFYVAIKNLINMNN